MLTEYASSLLMQSLPTVFPQLLSFQARLSKLGSLRRLAHDKALKLGFSIPLDKVVLSGSHTHSGPGAISPEFLWSVAPGEEAKQWLQIQLIRLATDLLVPELQEKMAASIANAMVTSAYEYQLTHF